MSERRKQIRKILGNPISERMRNSVINYQRVHNRTPSYEEIERLTGIDSRMIPDYLDPLQRSGLLKTKIRANIPSSREYTDDSVVPQDQETSSDNNFSLVTIFHSIKDWFEH